MTFERGFCPTCGVIDGKMVKSPPVPGWGEVGPNFDRCIIHAAFHQITKQNCNGWIFHSGYC